MEPRPTTIELPALHEAARTGAIEAVQACLSAGEQADVTISWHERSNVTPLMLAAAGGHGEVVALLLEAGAKPAAKDAAPQQDGGQNAMHSAAAGGHSGVIERLREAGARLNVLTRDGRSPLFEAIAAEQIDCALALLKMGANPNAGLPDTPLCLELALAMGAEALVAELKRRKAKRCRVQHPSELPLAMAVRHGSPSLFRAFLRHGARKMFRKARILDLAMLEAVSASIYSPLALVMLEQLLEAGADPNFAYEGETALLAATRGIGRPVSALRQLLAAGARPEVRNESGESPLLNAIDSLSLERVRLLLEAGAPVNAAWYGRTPLDGALESAPKMVEGEKLLLELRAAGAKTGDELRAAGVTIDDLSPPDDEAWFERPNFQIAAAAPAFLGEVRRLADLLGAEGRPMAHVPGGISFPVGPERDSAALLARERESCLEAGAFLFRSQRHAAGECNELAVFPTQRWQDVLLALGTNGANEGVHPPDVVAWLEKLEKTHPFHLLGAGWDWLEGRFLEPITDAKALAKRMYKFCPDIVDQGTESVSALARELESSQALFFWWD